MSVTEAAPQLTGCTGGFLARSLRHVEVSRALKAADLLNRDGIGARVVNMPTQQADRYRSAGALRRRNRYLRYRRGGSLLGGAVAEALT
jgi:transketolase C-terminal domain/subunit